MRLALSQAQAPAVPRPAPAAARPALAPAAAARESLLFGLGARVAAACLVAAGLPALVLVGWLAHGAGSGDAAALGTGLLLLALSLAVAAVAGRTATAGFERDLRRLVRVARRIAAGDWPHLAHPESSPELGDLSESLEKIGVRLEALESALDHLQHTSGLELGRRSNEVETLRAETERLNEEARHIHQFAAAIGRTMDPAQVCNQLVAHAERCLAFDWAAAYLVDQNTKRLLPVLVNDRPRRVRRVGHHLRELRELPELAEPGEKSCVAWVAQTGQPLLVGEGRDERWGAMPHEGMRSLLVVPLLHKGIAVGVVEVASQRPAAYAEKEERFLATLAGQAATSIENTRLVSEAAKVEALRQLDRFKSELLSTVSHELRTPLVSIKGYAETLLRDDVQWSDEERREFVQYIGEESERLHSLIEDLLQMSQIEAGKLKINRQSVGLARLAQRVARKTRLQAPRHTISASFPRDLPPADADPRRIEQVLTNLLQNAVKYSPAGGQVRVRGLLASSRPNGCYEYPGPNPDAVVVAVADEGVGIAAEHLERIFDRFYRVDGELARTTGGSGLGLPISKGLVEAHGGRIWVESPGVLVRAGEPGRGSTFYFSLPIRDPAADRLADDEEADEVAAADAPEDGLAADGDEPDAETGLPGDPADAAGEVAPDESGGDRARPAEPAAMAGLTG